MAETGQDQASLGTCHSSKSADGRSPTPVEDRFLATQPVHLARRNEAPAGVEAGQRRGNIDTHNARPLSPLLLMSKNCVARRNGRRSILGPVPLHSEHDMRLQGKAAIVTGGGSGFGEGIVSKFVAEGAKVLIADRDEANAKRVAEATEPAPLV